MLGDGIKYTLICLVLCFFILKTTASICLHKIRCSLLIWEWPLSYVWQRFQALLFSKKKSFTYNWVEEYNSEQNKFNNSVQMLTERCLHLGPWPSRSSQIFWNGCRSPWCSSRFFLRTRWLAIFDTTSRSRRKTKIDRSQWSSKWCYCNVAKEILRAAIRFARHRYASISALVFLEWKFVAVVLGEFQFKVLHHLKHCIFCK